MAIQFASLSLASFGFVAALNILAENPGLSWLCFFSVLFIGIGAFLCNQPPPPVRTAENKYPDPNPKSDRQMKFQVAILAATFAAEMGVIAAWI